MIAIRNYSKTYSAKVILSISNLTFQPGLALIRGANGSGKSTLFKSIAGIIPFDGTISLNDLTPLANVVAYRRRVNYAEAEPHYPGFVTPKDLIHFVGKAKQSPHEQQRHYTALFGVDDFFEQPCDTLSSGMLKKVSLVIAFLGDPWVIILDEPMITLDVDARGVLARAIADRHSQKTSFLISSHHPADKDEILYSRRYVISNRTIVEDAA